MSIAVTATVEIARPAAEVFAYLSDFENNPTWQKGMVSARWTSASRSAVGATYAQEARFLGRAIVTSFEITEFVPGERVRIASTSGTFPIQVTRTVEAIASDRCRATAHVAGEPGGLFKLAGPLLGAMVRRSVQADYARLKALLEDAGADGA